MRTNVAGSRLLDAGRNPELIDLPYCNCNTLILQCNNNEICFREGRGAEKWSVMLKKLNAMPALKCALIAGAAVLWLLGLSDQLGDVMQTAKYVGISLLLVAVAAIG